MVKVFVFSYFFWLVLCLIFITGTTRINIFCLGYLVACFYFMLFGGSVLMQPVRYVLRLWDWLIGYTCFVIAMKNLLSVSYCNRFVSAALLCIIVSDAASSDLFLSFLNYCSVLVWFLCLPGQPVEERLLVNSGLQHVLHHQRLRHP